MPGDRATAEVKEMSRSESPAEVGAANAPGKTSAGKVVIVGAGAVGTTFAYALQISGVAREIVLIDVDRKRAEGEVTDLRHGLFFTPSANIRAGDYEDCVGADVVVITAGAKQEPGQTRIDLVQTNAGICKDIVGKIMHKTCEPILLMVTNPVDVLTYAALQYSGLPRERVIGSGTVLDSARFRYLLSRHCRVNPHNVHAYVLGEHGDSEVATWSMTHIAGMPMNEYCAVCGRECSESEREGIADRVRDSAYHIIDAKGGTNYAVGLALVRIATSILRDENSVLTVSTLLEGELGIEDVCLSIPAIVNRTGAERIVPASLSDDELAALRSSAQALKKVLRDIGLQ
jgi:L-lactate dehydrogenase